jgi:hypothetical protein
VKRDLAAAHGRVFGIVHGVEFLDLVFGVIVDHDTQRVKHRHDARSALVEIVTDAELQQRHVDSAVALGNADTLAKVLDRLGRVTAPAQTRKRRHARVVPAAYMAFLDELQELSLAHHRIGHVEPRELDLPRMVDRELVEKPVVERSMVFIFERAERVGNAFRWSLRARAPSRTSDRCTTCRPADGAASL